MLAAMARCALQRVNSLCLQMLVFASKTKQQLMLSEAVRSGGLRKTLRSMKWAEHGTHTLLLLADRLCPNDASVSVPTHQVYMATMSSREVSRTSSCNCGRSLATRTCSLSLFALAKPTILVRVAMFVVC